MQLALGAHRSSIRISRAEWHPAGRIRFQPEWEPVPDPYADDNGVWNADSTKRLPRIPHRYQSALAGTALTILLTAVVSLGMTIRAVGFSLDLASFWLAAWQLAALIAVPARFILAPLVMKALAPFVEPPVSR
ncbi:MAG: DUF2798 domain-containing protein [Rhodomicrobiaceae bacterium]